MALPLKYASIPRLGMAFRDRFKEARGVEAGRLARWLVDRIADGTFTVAQIRSAFGQSAAQFTAFRTRVETLTAKYDNLQASVGE